MNRRPFLAILACLLSFSGNLSAGSDKQGNPQLELLKTVLRGVPVGDLTEVDLPRGVKGLTIVFRETRWELKDVPQSYALEETMTKNAMVLSEEERLAKMRKIENDVQVWLIPVGAGASSCAELKRDIPPNGQPHEFHREMAFVGKGHGFAWFAYAPIWQWIHMQKELGLQDGDDPIAAAIRGTTVEDRGSCTRNSCLAILGSEGPAVIPYLEAAIKDGHPSRENIIRNLRNSRSKAVTQWLIRQTAAKDEAVRNGARHCLIWGPRKEATPLYKRWLSEDAGKKDVLQLLKACRAVEMPGLIGLLPGILESPSSVHECRLAFELQRELTGEGIPDALLNGEKIIREFGYASGGNYSKEKVDDATIEILASGDLDAAAMIAISLATFVTKGDARAVREAGVHILKELPDGKGPALVSRLARSCDNYQKRRLEEIAGVLGSGDKARE